MGEAKMAVEDVELAVEEQAKVSEIRRTKE
jgi:hypothetical protein